MAGQVRTPRRVELWLRRGKRLRRPTSRQFIEEHEFREVKQPGVAYVVYEWIGGTYSDGKGGQKLGWKST